jgi:tight adherence protein B
MTPLLIRLGALIAIFASVFLISQLVGNHIANRRSERTAVNRRLTLLRSGADRDNVTLSLLKNAPPRLPPDAGPLLRMEVSFQRMVMMSAIATEARKIIIAMAFAFCVFTGLLLLLAMGTRFILTLGVVLLVVVIAAAISFGLPILVINRIAQRRQKLMVEQFPIALDIFTRSLRAGHPIASAIFLITEEMGDPIGSEFGLVSDEVSYGAELTDALLAMADRWNLEDMRMFVVAVSVQSETGGNLAEILENLSNVIWARASMYMKVRALSSEGRMTAWMLTVLPILTFVSTFAVSPAFYFDVAQDPIFLVGFPSLLLLYVIGVYIIRRMVDLKV